MQEEEEQQQNSCATTFVGQMEVSPEAQQLPASSDGGKTEHPEEAHTHIERTGQRKTEGHAVVELKPMTLLWWKDFMLVSAMWWDGGKMPEQVQVRAN